MTALTRYRCVVTGHDDQGRSIVTADREAGVGPLGIIELWKTSRVPAPLDGDEVDGGDPPRLEPPAAGTIFRLFEIPPEDPTASLSEAERAAQAAFGAAQASHCRVNTSRHPMMHTTASLDYVVLLHGEVTLLLDEGEVSLHPFDAVVQRGTNHYWINRSRDPALLLGVLLAAHTTSTQ